MGQMIKSSKSTVPQAIPPAADARTDEEFQQIHRTVAGIAEISPTVMGKSQCQTQNLEYK